MRSQPRWAFIGWLSVGLALGFAGSGCANSYTNVPVPNGSQGLSVVTVATRPGVTEPFLLMQQPNAWATVILFTGGTGELGITPTAFAFEPSNFLVRSREFFFAKGLNVAVVDAPSDQNPAVGLSGTFRISKAHAYDTAVVIQFLRKAFNLPVWTVGTSAGTLSVMSTAALLQGKEGPDGIVLTSSPSSISGVDLSAIRVPALAVQNRLDQCAGTPFSGMPALVAALSNAKPVQLLPVVGAGPAQGDPCEPFGFHGYPGIELDVVDQIADFIHHHI